MRQNMMEILDGLGASFSADRLARAYYDTLIVDFEGVDVPVAGELAGSVRNGTGGSFVITSQQLQAYTAVASGGAIAGTPFTDAPSPTIGSNTWYNYSLLSAKLLFNNRQIGGNKACPVPLWFRGPDGGPVYLTEAQPVVLPSENINLTIINAAPIAVRCVALFQGIVVPN